MKCECNLIGLCIRGGFRGGVDRGVHPVGLGQQGCKGGGAKISITIIAVNVHYKYSTLKREIKRRLNTNQNHSNKATHRELSLNKTLNLHYFILKINICRHFNF